MIVNGNEDKNTTNGLNERMTQTQAEAKAREYVTLLSSPDLPLEIANVELENGLYKIIVSVLGQTEQWHMSPDGNYLYPSAFTIDDIRLIVAQQQLQQAPQLPTIIENEEIDSLVSCLAENDFKIYGADWCGFTVQVVNLFGGVDINSIYVECTQEEELCRQEGITGYPTIKISGETANIARNLESFAQATNCPI